MKGVYLSSLCLRRELPEGSWLRRLGPVNYLIEGGVLEFDRPVTFLVGENGTGKSTLLEGVPDSGPEAVSPGRVFPPGGELLQCGDEHRSDG